MSKFLFLGLDIETTGSSPKSELIQIGLYTEFEGEKFEFVSDVGHRGNFHFELKAFEINRFTMQRIYDGPPVFEVDETLENWYVELLKATGVDTWNIVPTGFNVGSFDMTFVTKTFPRFRTLMGYRTCDLNAILLHEAVSVDEFNTMKKVYKEGADEYIAYGEAHDALYDAKQAFFIKQAMENDRVI